MSLYRRGRTWWIELTAHGRRIRESTGTADKKQAQEYHEKRKGEIWRQAKLGEAPPVTWGEAVKRWMEEKSRSLPERYMIREMGFSPSASMPLSSFDVEKKLSGLKGSTFNRYLTVVLAIHSLSRVQPPSVSRKANPQGRTRWLSAEEWQRLKGALAEESSVLHDAAEFTLATGLRENNVLNLEWGQIDLHRRVAWLYGDQMKGGVPHGLPLNDAAWAVLEARRGIHKKYVFPNPDTGLPYYKASNRTWYAALKKARLYRHVPGTKRLEVCWHTLRHTYAAWAVMSGVRLEELMKLGDWKTYSTVLRYAHLAPEHLADSAAKVKPISLSYNARKAGGRGTKSPTKGA